MGMEDNANCDLCGEPQEAVHILTECPGLVGIRINILGKPTIDPKDIKNYNIYKILKFAKQTKLWNIEPET